MGSRDFFCQFWDPILGPGISARGPRGAILVQKLPARVVFFLISATFFLAHLFVYFWLLFGPPNLHESIVFTMLFQLLTLSANWSKMVPKWTPGEAPGGQQ